MVKSFFDDLDRDIEDAARMDGSGEWRVFLKICLPQVYAGLAATFVFAVILTWNEFVFALLLTGTQTRRCPCRSSARSAAHRRRLGPAVGAGDAVHHSRHDGHVRAAKPAAARRHFRHHPALTREDNVRKPGPIRHPAHNVTKRFADLVAVDAATLTVASGEVVCLLGPSGCGKTTTLRIIAGLERATEGDITIAGRRVNHLPARERNVAMAFQFYALYPA